jgi:glycosyltransferase involved in cell wall biosynthesis
VSTVLSEISEECDVRTFTSDLNLRETGLSPPASPPEVTYLPSHKVFGERVPSPLRMCGALDAYRPDVVWTQHPSLTGLVGGAFALLTGRIWVATYHADLAPENWYARPFTWAEARVLAHANTVMVTSERYRSKLQSRGIRGPRTRTVLPSAWIGGGHPPLPLGTAVAEADRPSPVHAFLFVGGLDSARAYKRPEQLLTAVIQLNRVGLPVCLWMVGDGDRRPALESVVRSAGMEEKIRFLGSLSDEDLAQRYRSAWGFILPSDSDIEGFGAVCLEAIQYGCPVITSDAIAAGTVLRQREAALTYAAASPDGLQTTMRALWESPELRRKMSLAAERAAPEFSSSRNEQGMGAPLRDAARNAVATGGMP